jgi:hypothetical protein
MRTTQRTLFILLYVSAFATLTGAYIPLLSPFYDGWIPQISGYAMIHHIQPHSDFYSPFGLLYHQLNGLSFRLIHALPTLLQPFDINSLNSIIAAGCIGLLTIVIRADLPIPGIATLLITATALQIRPIATVEDFFNPVSFNWAGSYYCSLPVYLPPQPIRFHHNAYPALRYGMHLSFLSPCTAKSILLSPAAS